MPIYQIFYLSFTSKMLFIHTKESQYILKYIIGKYIFGFARII